MNSIIVLAASGILSMFIGVFKLKRWALPLVVAGCVVAFIMTCCGVFENYGTLLNGMLNFDKFSISFSAVLILITIAVFIISRHYYRENIEHLSDIYALFLFSLIGGILVVSFTNLVMLFLGIEILSIPLYILATSNRNNLFSNEAGLKYFLMGSFASCFLLLGITLVYGISGSFQLDNIADYVSANANNLPPLFTIGIILILAALLFKISAAPFHFWAPDVYQGSPTVITAFMSTVVKTAALGALIHFISLALLHVVSIWQPLLLIISIATMLVGNILALYQTNFKRLLAYSGIANAGYVLIAIATLHDNTYQYVLYYMIGYSVASIIAFAIYIIVKEHNQNDSIAGLQGLFAENKLLTVSLAIAMLSLAGIPPLVGFFGKWVIFSNALSSGQIWIVIIAILNSLVGMYYYLRVMVTSLQPASSITRISLSPNYKIILLVGIVLLVLLGTMPQVLVSLL